MPARKDEQYQKGIHALTYQHHREMPDVKTTNYLQGVRLQPWLKAKGADDVIYCFDDQVLETPRSNVFAVDAAGTLRTPETGMLKGITRNNVLALASAMMPVVEGPLSSGEISAASEVFITSTTKGILPVSRINHTEVGNARPGPFTQKLQQLLAAFENELLQP
jgi:branched-subunit amino acid aminotransferase/4-amino-4-deoxychorismate lyase